MIALRLLVVTVLAASAGCASFDPIEEEDLADPGRLEDTGRILPEREVLRYRGGLGAIPAGRATVRLLRRDGRCETDAELGTTGLVSLLYGVDLRWRSEARESDILSLRWNLASGDEDGKRVEVRYWPDRGRAISVKRQGEKVETKRIEERGLRDPLALLLALRRADLEPGRSFRSALFSEWHLYRADALVTSPERIRVPAGEFDTVRIRIDVTRVEDGRTSDTARALALWLTDDRYRVPVRLQVDSSLGRVTLELESLERGWPRVTAGRGQGAN